MLKIYKQSYYGHYINRITLGNFICGVEKFTKTTMVKAVT